jgi:hypothetical protein
MAASAVPAQANSTMAASSLIESVDFVIVLSFRLLLP